MVAKPLMTKFHPLDVVDAVVVVLYVVNAVDVVDVRGQL